MTDDFTGRTTVTVYKSGNSKVITIPPAIPTEVGDEYILTTRSKKLILEKTTTMNKGYNLKKLKKLVGLLPNSTKGMGVNELEKFLEGAYA